METSRRVLYHGTSAARWKDIRRRGLQPRTVTGRRSNWKGVVESRPHFVYLTDAYPVYFAVAAARSGSGYLILKVEVEERALFPDEDFVSWAMAKGDAREQTRLLPGIDPGEYQHLWPDSLRVNGVVCTPQVSPEQITAHHVIRPDAAELVMHLGGDAMPTPLNYRLFGGNYRLALETLFRGGENAALAMSTELFDLTES